MENKEQSTEQAKDILIFSAVLRGNSIAIDLSADAPIALASHALFIVQAKLTSRIIEADRPKVLYKESPFRSFRMHR